MYYVEMDTFEYSRRPKFSDHTKPLQIGGFDWKLQVRLKYGIKNTSIATTIAYKIPYVFICY